MSKTPEKMAPAPTMTLPDEEVTRTPGTVTLKDVQHDGSVVLFPMPTADPNDPLNWSKLRKAANFGFAFSFVFFTFVLINVIFLPYVDLVKDLGFTYWDFTTASALVFTGLAIGSVLFLPLLHKFGRRPLYLFSSCLQLAAGIWLSELHNRGDLIGGYFLSGVGGGLSETLLQISIVDLFFVHQRATMSALFLLAQASGSSLGPLAGGYIVDGQGWRWLWRWCAIFLGVNLLLVMFFFEESKYVPTIHGLPLQEVPPPSQDVKEEESNDTAISGPHRPAIDSRIGMRAYRQRLALITKTNTPVMHHFYQPFVVLLFFPAVTYAAVTYGTLNMWYSILVNLVDSAIVYPPWNFKPAGVGLITFALTIGTIIGAVLGGPLTDRLSIWLSGRNKGVFEPEMRLYVALVASIPSLIGILMVGLGLAHHLHWVVLAVGYGFFGFVWVIIGDCAIAYVTDCYQDLVGDALVAVVFIRNAFSMITQFALASWLKTVGIQDLVITITVLAVVFFLLPVPLMIWGKKFRLKTAGRYRDMALKMPAHRAIH